MKHIHKEELYIRSDRLSDQLFDYHSIFFDIETTGFSPAHSSIYLIGCAYRKEDQIITEQYFAENPSEEHSILCEFLAQLQHFSTLISFNGVGFDIPFLKAKCDQYLLPEHFKTFQYLDIFKEISHLKFLFKLANYKQKTIESFLGLKRTDSYSGGELINVYHEYVKNPDPSKEEMLLLHNYEDVIGMPELLPVLSYQELFHGQYAITETKVQEYKSLNGNSGLEFIITLKNDYPVPKRVSYQFRDFYLMMKEDISILRIPVFCGELRFFYSNYKDYYYLPNEDMAIHKSVASFVDKKYRENAHAATCYTRKTSTFLPQYSLVMKPEFKKEYKDSVRYFELTEDFRSSDIMLRRYVEHILTLMLTNKK